MKPPRYLCARIARRQANVLPILYEIRAAGARSYTGIAKALNMRGVATPRGRSRNARWHAAQVKRLLTSLYARVVCFRCLGYSKHESWPITTVPISLLSGRV